MTKTWRWLIVVSCFFLALATGTTAWLWLTKPTVLTVAVGPSEFDDATLIATLGRRLVASGASVRLSIVPTSGPVDAAERLTKGNAQLAVIRTDTAGAQGAQAIAVLHTDPVVVVASGKDKIDDFAKLKGKTLGVIGPLGVNDALVATLARQYRFGETTKALQPNAMEISAAIRGSAVDALLFVVPTTRGTKVGETWAIVRRATGRKLTFIPIDEADALAAANPAYEAGEISAGQFGGSPALPDESVTTILVDTYLVASRNVPERAVAALTRAMFEEKQAAASEAPIASLMKAASTDKDAVFPVHPGAKMYYDGEEQTLVERYGDWVWYGPIIFGALGSMLLFIKRFLGLQEESETDLPLSRIRELIRAIEGARGPADLDDVRARMDTAIEALAAQAARGEIDENRVGIAGVVVTYLDHLIDERRAILVHTPNDRPSGGNPPSHRGSGPNLHAVT